MLSINLDRETESYLAEIIAQENSTSEELLKKLIYQHWQTLKQEVDILKIYCKMPPLMPHYAKIANKLSLNTFKIVIKNPINERISAYNSHR